MGGKDHQEGRHHEKVFGGTSGRRTEAGKRVENTAPESEQIATNAEKSYRQDAIHASSASGSHTGKMSGIGTADRSAN